MNYALQNDFQATHARKIITLELGNATFAGILRDEDCDLAALLVHCNMEARGYLRRQTAGCVETTPDIPLYSSMFPRNPVPAESCPRCIRVESPP